VENGHLAAGWTRRISLHHSLGTSGRGLTCERGQHLPIQLPFRALRTVGTGRSPPATKQRPAENLFTILILGLEDNKSTIE
jgi:hypothetical protein